MPPSRAAPSRISGAGTFNRRTVAWLTLGLVLRIALAFVPRPADDDTSVYAELGQNLLHTGTYGIADDGTVYPSLFRLPGYPLFLAALGAHIPLVLAAQIILDLTGCLLLAWLVRRHVSPRAGWVTLALSTTCLFTATYAVIPMTECLSVFAVTGALWALTRLLGQPACWAGKWRQLVPALLPLAAFSALAMLLRPDGALVTIAAAAALVWYGIRHAGWARVLTTAVLFCMLAALPLVPWALRNELTFHVFQPLAPRHVNDPGERVNLGLYRWLRTWTYEYVNTGQVYWHVGLEPIALTDLPARAFDSPAERAQTAALIARYNVHHDVDPALDDDFNTLAAARIRHDPLRYFLWLPALRIADMTLRPRVDGSYLPADWQLATCGQRALITGLGLLNLFYVAAALCAVATRKTRRQIPAGAFMLVYVILRCALLATLENAEPRYTLEAYPLILVCAGIYLASWKQRVA